MNLVIKLLLKMAALHAFKQKTEALYTKGLDTVRRSLRFLFFILVLSQVFVCGLALTLYSVFQLLPIEEEARLYCMLGAGLVLFTVPLLFIAWGTSRRTWSI